METVEKLGKYEIKGTLGRGAMGVVYEGWDPTIQRIVAIKTIPITDADDAETQEGIARFRREAQAAGRLTHPNIVSVFDYGETSDLAYIVMEFVNGPSLKELMGKDDRFALEDTVKIMQDVLAGLEHSHEQGVVHRDIKPANLMLTSRERARARIKISDFGIARIESSSMTQAGAMMGTPTYMSPEQFMGQPVDARTDLYACGVLLYQLLTGERPFEGGLSAIMHKVLNTEPIPPSRLSVSVTPAIDAVVLKAMAKRPSDRFQTAIAFADGLAAAANGLPLIVAYGADPGSDDATLVASAPPNQAGPQSGPTEETMATAPGPMTGSASASMSAMAVSATVPVAHDATVIRQAATQRRGSAMPIIAGALAGLLVVGGGAAYVLTRPSAPPAPESSVAPSLLPSVASPPQSRPSVEASAGSTPAAPPVAAPMVASPTVAAPTAASSSLAVPTPTSPAPASPVPASPPPASPVLASPTVTSPTVAPTTPAPTTPAPTIPSAGSPTEMAAARPIGPVAPPPAPGPDIADIRDRFSQIIAGQTCSLMNGSVNDKGTVTLTGIAGPGVRDDVRDALAGAAIPLLWRTMAADSVFCQALDLLRPVGTPFTATEPRVTLTLADDRTALHDGQRIRPRLVMPNFAGYPRVDYVTHDGSVQHLFPQIADSSGVVADKVRPLGVGERLALGDPPPGQPAWEVGPPYGTDMIIAVVSTQPLFAKPRPSNVEHADTYLHDLASAIRTGQHAGMQVAGNALLVDTLPK
jgi:eukaryotic-like serine/threonine-protein kinase